MLASPRLLFFKKIIKIKNKMQEVLRVANVCAGGDDKAEIIENATTLAEGAMRFLESLRSFK